MTLQCRPSIQLNKSLTVLKISFLKTHKKFFELEIWQPIKYVFPRPARSTIRAPLEPTRTMTLLRRLSIQLNKSLTRLKITFMKTHKNIFWARNLTTYSCTFFPDQLDQQLGLYFTSLWHSYVDSQFNWTSPWRRLIITFYENAKNIFWARNLTTY